VLGAAGGVGCRRRARQGLSARGRRGGFVGGEGGGGAAAGADASSSIRAGPFDKEASKALAQQFKEAVGAAGRT
jgi:hypothetical protein